MNSRDRTKPNAINRYFGKCGGRRYIRHYGRPLSLYIDKHSTYKTTRQPSLDEILQGQSEATQVERACQELGSEVIHADSAQAKGLIERSFGTHQDRLVKERRLRSGSILTARSRSSSTAED